MVTAAMVKLFLYERQVDLSKTNSWNIAINEKKKQKKKKKKNKENKCTNCVSYGFKYIICLCIAYNL